MTEFALSKDHDKWVEYETRRLNLHRWLKYASRLDDLMFGSDDRKVDNEHEDA
jgi:hypothetical protein